MSRLFLIILLFLSCVKADAQNTSAIEVGDSLYALGNYSLAIKNYQKSNNTEEKIARAYAAVGNNTKALHYYKASLNNGDASVLSRYNYGKLLIKANRYQEADSLFERLSKANPKNPEFFYQLGVVKEKVNDPKAFVSYLIALSKDENHQNALFKVAKFQAEKRNFNEAMVNTDKGLAADPNSVRFLRLKALISYVNKSFHNAATTYERLLNLNQGNELLHEHLAICYNQTNRFEQAIKQYAILINEYDDKNPSYHFNLAKNYEALRYLEKAQHHFEISIALQDMPLDQSYLALSSVFKKQKDYKSQFATLQKAVRENPTNQRAKYLLATAADNYFEDDNKVLEYYESYLEIFGESGNFAEFAKARIKDLKTDLHLNKN